MKRNMTRRTFIKGAGLMIAACAAPGGLVPVSARPRASLVGWRGTAATSTTGTADAGHRDARRAVR